MKTARYLILSALLASLAGTSAYAQNMPGNTSNGAKPVEVTADQSLEWYQDQSVYVARGNAKAVRGDMTVEADLLTAHEREKQAGVPKPQKTGNNNAGDIDRMTADGNVRITNPKQKVFGDKAVYDLDQHVMVVTGNNLKYETDKETVTARDSLEYWEDRKIAVARGNAVADKGERHVEGDVLTAEFRDQPNGSQELTKMTAVGHVTVVTKGSVARGNQAVYDVSHDLAVLTGNVRITRSDGTQLSGDVGEVNFKTNQSRLMNEGHGRVRALLTSKSTDKTVKPKNAVVAQ